VILVVQRSWSIAQAVSSSFKANGAEVLLSVNPKSALRLVDHPHLSAAVLDSNGPELCRYLDARGIPYVLYTGRKQIADECAAAPVVRKPASPTHVVESVERLLTRLNGYRVSIK
jgi:DNA-binding response OmpR family regulator